MKKGMARQLKTDHFHGPDRAKRIQDVELAKAWAPRDANDGDVEHHIRWSF